MSSPLTSRSVLKASAQTGWFQLPNIAQIMGLTSVLGVLIASPAFSGGKWIVLGGLVESGRRMCQWLSNRLSFRYRVTGHFREGNPAYEWIVTFLNREKVYLSTCDFHVNSTDSKRKWGVTPGLADSGIDGKGNAEYVPTYQTPRLFRWRGYWVEVMSSRAAGSKGWQWNTKEVEEIGVTIYTRNLSALREFVDEARNHYAEICKPHLTVHIPAATFGMTDTCWGLVKNKTKRSLDSVVLEPGMMNSLVDDARHFFGAAEWYAQVGIPHRRGYLLHGPPGTGKTSTIYALAGELGLEIFSLSLSSGMIDDEYLQRAVSEIPKGSILLIEDIDCAFPSRQDPVCQMPDPINSFTMQRQKVSMSGLLNVLDGVGSEEGTIFVATTNHIDKIDPALLRPGRIDRKIEYSKATRSQAASMFKRFFPEKEFADADGLCCKFVTFIPEQELTTAELQGFLLTVKDDPQVAVDGVAGWVEAEARRKRETAENNSLLVLPESPHTYSPSPAYHELTSSP